MAIKPGLGTPGGVVDAADHRRSLSGLWLPSSAADPLVVRGGIVPGPGEPLRVRQASPLAMAVQVNAGVLEVWRDGYGLYAPSNDAVETLVVDEAPAANSRWDLLVMGQHDEQAGDGDNQPVLQIITGTAQAVPTKPYGDVEAGCTVLAEIGPITSATTQITDSLITNVAVYTAVRGTPLRVRNQDERDALNPIVSATNPITVERLDTGQLERNTGSGWVPLAGSRLTLGGVSPSFRADVTGTQSTAIVFDEPFAEPPAVVCATVIFGTGVIVDCGPASISATGFDLRTRARTAGTAGTTGTTTWIATGRV